MKNLYSVPKKMAETRVGHRFDHPMRVIPVQTGTHLSGSMDSRLRGNDNGRRDDHLPETYEMIRVCFISVEVTVTGHKVLGKPSPFAP